MILEQINDYLSCAQNSLDEQIAKNFITFYRGCERSGSNSFDRYNLPGHFTASTIVIWKNDGLKTILTLHKKLNSWLQPGGHADGNSNLLEVAQDELKEETGLVGAEILADKIFDLSINEIPTYANMPAHLHYDVRYLAIYKGDGAYQVSDESEDLAWFSIEEILTEKQVSESLLRSLRKVRDMNLSST
jgi:8-oxo-dGTP pyrophosphatase MutT (NUDIX family)